MASATRPASLRSFDRLFAIALPLWLARQFIVLDGFVRPDIEATTAQGLEDTLLILGIALLSAALWFLVSRRGRAAAKWPFIVLTALVIVANGWIAVDNFAIVPLDAVLLLAITALEIAQIVLLLRADTTLWLWQGEVTNA